MSPKRFLACLALACLVPVLARSAPPSPSVDEIVARHVAARGGLERIRSVHTLRQTGHANAGANREGRVTRELKLPGRSRFELTVQGVTGVYVSDGRRGWRVSPFEGDTGPKELSEQAVQEAAEQADFEGPLVDWKAKGHRVELVSRESVSGREAYKLEIKMHSGAVKYWYLDVKTLNLVRADSTREVRGLPVRVESTFGDYRKTGGLLFPRRIEVQAEGRPDRLLVTVDTVEINPALSDARFETSVPPEP